MRFLIYTKVGGNVQGYQDEWGDHAWV